MFGVSQCGVTLKKKKKKNGILGGKKCVSVFAGQINSLPTPVTSQQGWMNDSNGIIISQNLGFNLPV